MSSTARGGQKSPADNYPSPNWTIHRFLDRFVVHHPELGDLWLEPGAGEGNLIHATQEWTEAKQPWRKITWDACDIRVEVEPFLDNLGVRNISIGDYFVNGPPTDDKYDMIITNPPFSLAMPFINRSLEANTRFVVMLQRLNFMGSINRHAFMQRYHPDLYILPNRPSFKATGATDSIEYAWFVWDKENLQRSSGTHYLLDTTPKADRKAEHERLKQLKIFPILGESEEEEDGQEG